MHPCCVAMVSNVLCIHLEGGSSGRAKGADGSSGRPPLRRMWQEDALKQHTKERTKKPQNEMVEMVEIRSLSEHVVLVSKDTSWVAWHLGHNFWQKILRRRNVNATFLCHVVLHDMLHGSC